MTKKTLAMRVLDSRKVDYAVTVYPQNERDAKRIATLMKVDPSLVYKTLVVLRAAGKPLLAMIPSNSQLDLKQVARSVGEKKVKMASHKEAESLTGLQVGGISALALLNRGFVPLIDSQARDHRKIYISAGKRGQQISLSPIDLINVTGARVIDAMRR
jgi:Cys-tRNA(Pro)/Cys-tRNA(Cys) deacylase